MDSEQKLSVVIPCYRSQDMIEGVIERLVGTLTQRLDESHFEIILIDDCSPDDTYKVLSDIAAARPYVKVIHMARNFGQHSALMAGFAFVTGDIVVCMDDDGQTPPEEIFKLVDKIGEGYDLVYAKYHSKKHSLIRNWGSQLNELMAQSLIGKPKEITMSSYFAAERFLIDEALRYQNPYPYVEGLMLRATKNIANVDVEHSERLAGESGYSFVKLVGLWLNGFTAFSVKPLRLGSVMGTLFAAIGFISAIIVVIRRFINPVVAIGWASTFSAMLIIGGMILAMLGMLGEYIGRIYISLNNSPQYVIKSTLNCGDETYSQGRLKASETNRLGDGK
ncbi:glycosyltransferase [Slackia heliotrinireducens]|uniref:glycosyltransferase n=1 Tax=Slackia heliotrinireducens TaxID=84110 RepID=UPI0033159D99